MTDTSPLRDSLHRATHRIPGVPAHMERPAGHQGITRHGQAVQTTTGRRSPHRTGNHSPERPPRVLVAWQRRIAAFFGKEAR